MTKESIRVLKLIMNTKNDDLLPAWKKVEIAKILLADSETEEIVAATP